jgi:para-aminobenzoate synthetase component 1
MRQRLLRHPLGRWVDPADVFAGLYGDETDVVWLDSGVDATSGHSYLGKASRTISAATVGGSVLDYLREELADHVIEGAGDGFALGWVGWIGYETRFETMRSPRTQSSPYPDGAFLYLEHALEFDHARREVTLLALGTEWEGAVAEWRDAVVRELSSGPFETAAERPPQGRHAQGPAGLGPTLAVWRDTDEEYLAKIRACKAAIAAGDAYQLCLTTEAWVDVTPDPFATYLALRAGSPSHHGALLRIGDIALLSSSPEQFLVVHPDGVVETRPIKGTRPRGDTPERDATLAAELEASDKERAENLMIVDLMRNDIGRVSLVGSVEVTSLLAVESYAHVHQLVSTVRGRLEHGLVGMDAVVACFPAGSMTGAPKSSAVRILDTLEVRPRGIYAGAFGYFGLDGRIDLAMVIRSIVLSPDGATIGAGGGITTLSDPDEELAEAKLKAAALLRVLGVSTP